MAAGLDVGSVPVTGSSSDYVRLHITPFNPTLLNTIIPASSLPNARNISYHSLQTFPEKAYGYVELPTMEAEKLKKKLNGSILKGVKLRIEKARPKKEITTAAEVEEKPVKEKKSSSKKRKRDPDTLEGVEIGDRHVKRGWTTPPAAVKSERRSKNSKEKEKEKKKAVVRSKFTTDPECLFRTVLPPNVAANVADPAATKAKPDKKKRSKKGKEVLVHEFAKTTKYPSFLKSSTAASSSSKPAVEFVEGTGWVDEDGNVVEAVTKKVQRPAVAKSSAAESRIQPTKDAQDVNDTTSEEDSSSDDEEPEESKDKTAPVPAVEDSETSSSGTSSEDEEEEEGEGRVGGDGDGEKEATVQAAADDSETSSSGPSSEESDSDDSSEDETPAVAIQTPERRNSKSNSSGQAPNLSITIPPPIPSTPIASTTTTTTTTAVTTTASGEVHPLEALFKKPRPEGKLTIPEAPSFSFFGSDDGDVEDDKTPNAVRQYTEPMTPFTQKDFEYRGIRSAAPTPDTGFRDKKFIWPSGNGDEGDEDYDGSPSRGDKAAKTGAGEDKEAESDFQKWFYENRGETNRAWKKRRKMVGKEKRQRENRKRADRG